MGKPPKSKSKKRKYASQPRATKIKKGKKGTELPTLQELPEKKIRKPDQMPHMTFFHEKGLKVPKEINNIKIISRESAAGQRSISSARSQRSISHHS